MKKKIWAMATMLFLSLPIAVSERAAVYGQSDNSDDVTLKGEVVDMHCYVSRGAKGSDHAGCANSCISRGTPAAFLAEDGNLYVILDANRGSANEKVANFAGKQIALTGKIIERDGLKAILLKSIEQTKED